MDLSKVDSAELAHVFALEARLMDDVANPARVPIDAIYLMSHGVHYEQAIMNKGVERYRDLYLGGDSPVVLYCGEPPASSFRGGEVWAKYLQIMLPAQDPVSIFGALYMHKEVPMINSFSEARPVLAYMIERGLKNLELIALPFHVQRSFVGFVTEILAMGLDINVFARVTGHISFTEASIHSQGIQGGTASEFAETEIEKVLSYRNLATPSEILRYLDERDRRIV